MVMNQQVITPPELNEEQIEPFEMANKTHFERMLELESNSESELERYGIINYNADTSESNSDLIDEINDS